MSKGVLAIFGQTSFSSAKTIESYANQYNLPFININHPKNIFNPENEEKNTNINYNHFKPTASENLKSNSIKNDKINQVYQMFMHPNLVPLLISLTKYHRWKNVYYLYNNHEGELNIYLKTN